MKVEQHQISKNHELWNFCDDLCFKTKNLYNAVNYSVRQVFINNRKWKRYSELNTEFFEHQCYRNLMIQSSQQTIKLVERNWKSFFQAIKSWNKNKSVFTGKPNLPKYLKKTGRFIHIFTNQSCKIKDGYLRFPLKLGKLRLKTKLENLQEVRIIPKNSIYVIEIVYKTEEIEINPEVKNIMGIDLGVNNLAASGILNNVTNTSFIINGRPLKSINQFYNKRIAELQSKLPNKQYSSKKIERITLKRNNKVKDYLHKSSKFVVQQAVENKIDTIIIGKNDGWKQNLAKKKQMSRKTRQSFVEIPFVQLLQKIEYKAKDFGIKTIFTEESFTSGTSFLDGELPIREFYNKSRRITRGLFKSNNKIRINADLNGALQIIKKVVPDYFSSENFKYYDRIEELVLVPKLFSF